jgi:hypothetical protein
MTANPADLPAAHVLMAFPLGSHIALVPFGVAPPLVVSTANDIGPRSRERVGHAVSASITWSSSPRRTCAPS